MSYGFSREYHGTCHFNIKMVMRLGIPIPEKVVLIWIRSWRCSCLVTWFCYQLIAKPGNKTVAPPWPDPFIEIDPGGQWVPAIPPISHPSSHSLTPPSPCQIQFSQLSSPPQFHHLPRAPGPRLGQSSPHHRSWSPSPHKLATWLREQLTDSCELIIKCSSNLMSIYTLSKKKSKKKITKSHLFWHVHIFARS